MKVDTYGLQGPLVGQKKSSYAITEEYAKADPVYVQKTAVSNADYLDLYSESLHTLTAVQRSYLKLIPIIARYSVMAIVVGGVSLMNNTIQLSTRLLIFFSADSPRFCILRNSITNTE